MRKGQMTTAHEINISLHAEKSGFTVGISCHRTLGDPATWRPVQINWNAVGTVNAEQAAEAARILSEATQISSFDIAFEQSQADILWAEQKTRKAKAE